ncbi:MAG: S46 family peptidase [Myxococcales bacterium]|nr:S46 family peptidase [Myxococcales bacterium]
MRRIWIGSFLATILAAGAAVAEEGMWTPDQIGAIAPRLAEKGLQISAANLADLDKGPLGAVIFLGGCTASFVSPDGLVVTNHHCAVGAIQRNSTPENNLLKNGFVAATRKDELWAGPAARIWVTRKETDVTDKMTAAVAKIRSDVAAFEAIDAVSKALVAECEQDKTVRCEVAVYDAGGRYVLNERLEIRDVRLVHAPPDAIGSYGGDIDNWMWPRHTGDWSLFRAYVGQDGKPAEYSEQNVPFKPSRYLEVSSEGVADGDLVFVAGYPGSTSRNLTAAELTTQAEVVAPQMLRTFQDLVDIVHEEQKRSPEAAVKLTPTRDGLANGLKYMQGLNDGFAKSGIVAERKKAEAAFLAALDADKVKKKKVRPAIDALFAAIETNAPYVGQEQILRWMLRLPVALRTAATIHWLAVQRELPDEQRDEGFQKRDEEQLWARLEQLQQGYVPEADKAFLRYFLAANQKLPAASQITPLVELVKEHGGEQQAVDALYKGLEVDQADSRKKLFSADKKTVEASADPLIQLAKRLYPVRDAQNKRGKKMAGAEARFRPVYLQAWRDHLGGLLYPDANATLRITYGDVQGYSPREAITYAATTTARGILEKHTGVEPFDAPETLRKAIERVHQGQKSNSDRFLVDNTVPVNFLSTCDTTGGNSGSPTLDARGRLVGLLFDGNYESMASDWAFDTVRNRSIHVDIRYLLWSLAEVVQGQHLLSEMGIDLK